MTQNSFQLAVLLLSLAGALVAAITDLRSRRIPNWLTVPMVLTAWALHLAAGGWIGLGTSVLGMLLCGGVFLLFYLAGGMGAGDVKLIAAQGCLLGLSRSGLLLAATAIAGGVLALALAAWRGGLRQTAGNVLELVGHHRRNGITPHPELNVLNTGTLRLPYALAIAAGTLITVLLEPTLRSSL